MLARFFIDRPVFAWVLAILVMMAGALPTTTAAGLICTANPPAVAAWTVAWQAVLALLPDSANVAFEPLNEPPNCADGNRV